MRNEGVIRSTQKEDSTIHRLHLLQFCGVLDNRPSPACVTRLIWAMPFLNFSNGSAKDGSTSSGQMGFTSTG